MWHRIGYLCCFQMSCAAKPGTYDVVCIDQRITEASHLDVAQLRMFDICEIDPLAARASHIREGETIERFVGMDANSIYKHRYIRDPNVAEMGVSDGRNPFVSGDTHLILLPAIEDVDAKKALLRAGYLEIVHIDVFDKSTAARPALDIDCEGLCPETFAMFDVNVADTAGGFTPYTDTSPMEIGKLTV
jgi:hypothetical protein